MEKLEGGKAIYGSDHSSLHKKWSFLLRTSSVNVTKSVTQETVDLITFTEEIVNGKLLFLCNGWTFVWITHSFSFSLSLSWYIVQVEHSNFAFCTSHIWICVKFELLTCHISHKVKNDFSVICDSKSEFQELILKSIRWSDWIICWGRSYLYSKYIQINDLGNFFTESNPDSASELG